MSDDELIARHIELNPPKPSLAEARLTDFGIAVWALVASWQGLKGDVDGVATAHHIPREAVQAALAYYRRHKPLIDARLEANAA